MPDLPAARGRARAAWLPDSLRRDWTRFVNRLNQQVTRGQCTRAAHDKARVAARRDAERVAQGKELPTAWVVRWTTRKQRDAIYQDPKQLAGARLDQRGEDGETK